MSFGEMVIRLVLALVLGSLIGMERETHGRPAGLRTHVLVCMGSTLFTLCSYVIAVPHNDPGRIAAQIVTGIGFLGAGTIIHQGSIVRGLTTAASIWVVAAIGLAVGIGTPTMVGLAAVASVMVFGTLYLMGQLDQYLLSSHGERLLTITTGKQADRLCEILQMLPKHSAKARSIDSYESDDDNMQVLRLRLRVGRDFDEAALGSELTANEYVISCSWE